MEVTLQRGRTKLSIQIRGTRIRIRFETHHGKIKSVHETKASDPYGSQVTNVQYLVRWYGFLEIPGVREHMGFFDETGSALPIPDA